MHETFIHQKSIFLCICITWHTFKWITSYQLVFLLTVAMSFTLLCIHLKEKRLEKIWNTDFHLHTQHARLVMYFNIRPGRFSNDDWKYSEKWKYFVDSWYTKYIPKYAHTHKNEQPATLDSSVHTNTGGVWSCMYNTQTHNQNTVHTVKSWMKLHFTCGFCIVYTYINTQHRIYAYSNMVPCLHACFLLLLSYWIRILKCFFLVIDHRVGYYTFCSSLSLLFCYKILFFSFHFFVKKVNLILGLIMLLRLYSFFFSVLTNN